MQKKPGFVSRLFSGMSPKEKGRAAAGPAAFSSPASGDPVTEAARLAAALPALLADAERIAATVSAGHHGRRRAGPGEAFWQYRPAQPGEPVSRIDWRQSGRSSRAYVRETEAENAQTVFLWCDLTPSMRWSSGPQLPQKQDRAILLMLATATLLEAGGERVNLLTQTGPALLPPGAGRIASRIATVLPVAAEQARTALPVIAELPRFSKLLLFSDFLMQDTSLKTSLDTLTARAVQIQPVLIADPAERDLPYSGRIRFTGTEGEPEIILPKVETLRPDYETLFSEHETSVHSLTEATGQSLLTHFTDQSPAMALLSLSTLLSGAGRQAGGRF